MNLSSNHGESLCKKKEEIERRCYAYTGKNWKVLIMLEELGMSDLRLIKYKKLR